MNRSIEIELALLDQLHDGDGVEQLRNGTGAVDRIGGGGLVFAPIGFPIAGGVDDLTIDDPSHGKAGQDAALEFLRRGAGKTLLQRLEVGDVLSTRRGRDKNADGSQNQKEADGRRSADHVWQDSLG